MDLVTTKAAAKLELSFNEPASGARAWALGEFVTHLNLT